LYAKCFVLFLSVSYGHLPCGVNGAGLDPCSAEPLSLGSDCSGEEVIRTNGCAGDNPTASSCGLAAGTHIVWTTFLVGVQDDVTITWTATSVRNIRMGLYQFTDSCGFPPTGEVEIACMNDYGNGGDETMTVNLMPGQYWICGSNTTSMHALHL
jgi:hypothetical protein